MKLKTLTLISLVAGSLSLRAADAPFSSLTALTNLAAGDLFAVTDISDTTQSANGTTKQITATNVSAFFVSDTAYSVAFNGLLGAPSKNTIYDQLHIGDADDDGKIDVIDTAAAGFPSFNSSGAFVASRVVTEGTSIDVTNGDGASGNPTIDFDPTELTGNRTWADGTNASILWTFNLSGTDPVLTFSSGVFNVSTGTLQQGGVDVATISGSQTLTTKTIDSASNVVKFKSFPQFASPLRTDGTNATIGSTVGNVGYGLATFSNSVDEASNWVEWRIVVPADWDTGVDPRVRVIDVIGADTGARQYVLSVASVAASASSTTSPGTAIDINMAADGSGASGDVEISSTTTLTGWGAAVTPGNMMIIRLARDGDQATQDASTVNSTAIVLELEYGASQ